MLHFIPPGNSAWKHINITNWWPSSFGEKNCRAIVGINSSAPLREPLLQVLGGFSSTELSIFRLSLVCLLQTAFTETVRGGNLAELLPSFGDRRRLFLFALCEKASLVGLTRLTLPSLQIIRYSTYWSNVKNCFYLCKNSTHISKRKKRISNYSFQMFFYFFNIASHKSPPT